jgi:CBS-domain-containing membrane protein
VPNSKIRGVALHDTSSKSRVECGDQWRWLKQGNPTVHTKNETGGAMYGIVESTVSQFMTQTVITVNRQTTMCELATLFEKHDFNAFPVVEDGKLSGIISKFDFLRAFAFTTSQVVPHYNELMRRPAADVMTEAVVHVDPTSPLTRVFFS